MKRCGAEITATVTYHCYLEEKIDDDPNNRVAVSDVDGEYIYVVVEKADGALLLRYFNALMASEINARWVESDGQPNRWEHIKSSQNKWDKWMTQWFGQEKYQLVEPDHRISGQPNVISTEDAKERYMIPGHSSMVKDGDKVRFAGHFKSKANKINYLDNLSGHYQPNNGGLMVMAQKYLGAATVKRMGGHLSPLTKAVKTSNIGSFSALNVDFGDEYDDYSEYSDFAVQPVDYEHRYYGGAALNGGNVGATSNALSGLIGVEMVLVFALCLFLCGCVVCLIGMVFGWFTGKKLRGDKDEEFERRMEEIM